MRKCSNHIQHKSKAQGLYAIGLRTTKGVLTITHTIIYYYKFTVCPNANGGSTIHGVTALITSVIFTGIAMLLY